MRDMAFFGQCTVHRPADIQGSLSDSIPLTAPNFHVEAIQSKKESSKSISWGKNIADEKQMQLYCLVFIENDERHN